MNIKEQLETMELSKTIGNSIEWRAFKSAVQELLEIENNNKKLEGTEKSLKKYKYLYRYQEKRFNDEKMRYMQQ